MRSFLINLCLFLCAACGATDVATYRENTPRLDLREFFNGDVFAYGTIHDYSGKLNSTFTVEVKGEWEGNSGVLTEYFTYADRTTESRIWSITFTDDNGFIATADDVVGEAVGYQYGNAVNLKYTLRQKRGDGTIDLAMDDWMYLIDDKHLINKTSATKFGFDVADVTIGFVKR